MWRGSEPAAISRGSGYVREERVADDALGEQARELLCRNGRREVEALSFRALPGLQELQLIPGLYPLGDHAHVQAPAHIDDGADDAGVVRIAGYVADERLVDLQRIDRKPLHVAQARIARAEIVERNAHAESLQGAQDLGSRFPVLHHEGLGELELEKARLEPVLLEDLLHVRE